MPKQPENSCQWLAAIHPTFLNLRVKCLKGSLVSMTIKSLSGSRIKNTTPYPNLKIFVLLHHLVLPQNDRQQFIFKRVVGFLLNILYIHILHSTGRK